MNYFHSGDLGDVVYALPSIRSLGRGSLHLNTRPWTAPMTPERAKVLKPLLESQSYLSSVTHGECVGRKVDFSTFRNGGLFYGVSLAELQSNWVGADYDPSPWLDVDADRRFTGTVVCHRSPRYNNPYFRWDLVGKKFKGLLVFVGMESEVEALRKETGVNAEHVKTKDYLELARVLKGAQLFIGNQSSPMSVAIGLGVPFIQEVCLWTPDCLYPRKNGVYCYDGGVPHLGFPAFNPPPDVDRGVLPPGGWQCVMPVSKERRVFKAHRKAVSALMETGAFPDPESAAVEVDRQNAARCPFLTKRDSATQIFGKVKPLVDAVNNLATV